MEYNDVIEKIKNTYGEPIIGLLNEIKADLEKNGIACEQPFEMFDDEYRWVLDCYYPYAAQDNEHMIDITLEIAEQRMYEGGEDYGINFGINVVEYGGRILGQFNPFNFTGQVWVDARDSEAVLERWNFFKSFNVDAISSLILGDNND